MNTKKASLVNRRRYPFSTEVKASRYPDAFSPGYSWYACSCCTFNLFGWRIVINISMRTKIFIYAQLQRLDGVGYTDDFADV